MKKQTSQSGYTLVEVLVAVMVLLLAIVGPMTIASKGLKNASKAKEQTTAFFLAQEGLEAVIKVREDAALAVYSGSSVVSTGGNSELIQVEESGLCSKHSDSQWDSDHSGYTGSGFYAGWSGNWVRCTFDGQSTDATLTIRYASNGRDRPVDVRVNGTTVGSMDILETASWNTWNTESFDLTLTGSNDEIRLQKKSYIPNVDWMQVVSGEQIVQSYTPGDSTWAAVETVFGDSTSSICTEVTPCGIDMLNNGAPFLCSSDTCDLYYSTTSRSKYNHDSGGTPTKFNREVIVDVDESRLHVRSIVTWGPDPDERIELSEYLYNIYDE